MKCRDRENPTFRDLRANVAQLAERWSPKPVVRGSTPLGRAGDRKFPSVPRLASSTSGHRPSRAAGFHHVSSNRRDCILHREFCPPELRVAGSRKAELSPAFIAQQVERSTRNGEVAGSIPVEGSTVHGRSHKPDRAWGFHFPGWLARMRNPPDSPVRAATRSGEFRN